MKTKPNFPLTGKCFPLTNFSNGKQTQESLESGFPETTFRKTNTAKGKTLSWKLNQIFLWLESVFRWQESVFRWPESVLRWLESVFRWPTFLIANKHRKVWKVVSRKMNSGNKHGLDLLHMNNLTINVFLFTLLRSRKQKCYILDLLHMNNQNEGSHGNKYEQPIRG